MRLPNLPADRPVRISFVCSGNICRSPTAEVVLRSLAGPDEVEVESAGTGGWHAGDDMDRRSRATMADAGYAVDRHEARQFEADDFDRLDLVVALAGRHRDDLLDLARGDTAAAAKVVLLREFDPQLVPDEAPDVADPYYGGASGFADVLDQVERSCAALLASIRHERQQPD